MSAAAMIETELWVSLVAMLRSYAAAASLHAGEVRVVVDGNAVRIAAGVAELEMEFEPESGAVTWSRHEGGTAAARGSFTIEDAGVVRMDGVARDLDHAAIDFVASVTESAKGGRK